MRFSVGRTSKSQEPSWWLYDDDDDASIAWAGETFASLANAERAARAFKAGAATARYEVYQDTAGQWRWRAWRSSDKVAASRPLYDSRAQAQRAADDVRDHAGTATGV